MKVALLLAVTWAALACVARSAIVHDEPLIIAVCSSDKVNEPGYTLPNLNQRLIVSLVNEHSSKLTIKCGESFTVAPGASAFLMRQSIWLRANWASVPGVNVHYISSSDFVVITIPAELSTEFAAVTAERELLRPLKRIYRPASSILPKSYSSRSTATKAQVINSLSSTEYYSIMEGLSGVKPITVGGSTYTLNSRYTLAEGNDNAAQWIAQYFRSVGLTEVILQPFTYSGKRTNNIIAIKRGSTNPREIVVIGAHMDSTSQSPSTLAPGCIDNGSGTVAVMLAAKAMANITSDRTIYYVLFSAEEQGLIGSEYFVDEADSDGLNIVAALTMDMIGYSNRYYGVLIEGTQNADIRELMDLFESNIKQFTQLTTEKAYFSYGSDHVSFQQAGIPAFLAIEQDNTDYGQYHRTTDTITYLDLNQSMDILKGMVGTLYDVAGSQ